MTRLTLQTRVGADGVLHIPLGQGEANRDVRVTIEAAGAMTEQSDQEYLDFLRATAGAWQGDFERPQQGDCEVRDPWNDIPPGLATPLTQRSFLAEPGGCRDLSGGRHAHGDRRSRRGGGRGSSFAARRRFVRPPGEDY